MAPNKKETFYKLLVLTGTMLVMSPLCFSFIYGNLTTYMYSVFFSRSLDLSGDMDPAWIFSIHLLSCALGTLMLDATRRKFGLRFVTALGISLYCASFFLTYFTVTHSVWATSLTFAFLTGLGTGLSEMALLYYVAGWFKARVGLASALVFCAGSVGGMVINPFLTANVNPHGYSRDSSNGPITYFSQSEVLDRIPMAFIFLGSVITALQCTGFSLLRNPPASEEEEDHKIDERNKDIEEAVETRPENAVQYRNYARQSDYTSETGSSHPNERSDDLELNCKKPIISPSSDAPWTVNEPREATTSESENERQQRASTVEDTRTATAGHDQGRVSKTPIQVLKSEKFYIVTFSLVTQTLCLLIAVNYNKLFGQILIADDSFFALTNSAAAGVLMAFRLAGGHMIDWLGVKATLVTHIASCSILLGLWYFTAMLNRWVYLMWTCCLLSVSNNVFLIYPMATLKLFGQSFFATNLGLIQTASVAIYLVAPPLLTVILYSLGWFWLFFTAAGMLGVMEIVIICRM